MKTSIEIAQEAKLKDIIDIAKEIGLDENHLELYGRHMAKISLDALKAGRRIQGRLIVISALTPTRAGEGKTTIAIGLGETLGRYGKKGIICIRQPSLGPVFGVKGGGAGGGYAQVQPMYEVNLHFTGDIHAITSAHNLLAAMLDNHIFQDNELKIDLHSIVWRRVLDMNERALRNIMIGLGGRNDGVPRQSGFDITAASEVTAALALSTSLSDLKERLSKIIVAFSKEGSAITANDLKASGAMTLLLKDALKPNLIQTLENTPAFVHGGPYGNIAHGCPSLTSMKLALSLADYVIVEPGFAADLGAEKFFDIVCPLGNLHPDLVVLVATIKALKHHGGVPEEMLGEENTDAVVKGFANLEKHIEIIQRFQVPLVVTLNKFPIDSSVEIEVLQELVQDMGIGFAVSEVFEKGGEGGLELAECVIKALDENSSRFQPLYDSGNRLTEKVHLIATKIYGAKDVVYTEEAEKDINLIEQLGLEKLPICVAKTQYSLSDNPSLLGRPQDFRISVKAVKPHAGAGFLVVYAGDINTMPGLPKRPAAEKIDIYNDGRITGLF